MYPLFPSLLYGWMKLFRETQRPQELEGYYRKYTETEKCYITK